MKVYSQDRKLEPQPSFKVDRNLERLMHIGMRYIVTPKELLYVV